MINPLYGLLVCVAVSWAGGVLGLIAARLVGVDSDGYYRWFAAGIFSAAMLGLYCDELARQRDKRNAKED